MKERRRTTIRDVSKACGVALSTVSNALAGKPYVSSETRKLVVETAASLGYRVSTVARALRTQRSFTIGVLVADVANPVSPAFVRGIEDVAIREGCTFFLCNTDGDEEKQLSYMRALLDRRVDGMVLISQHCESPAVRELLRDGPPFVLVQRRSRKHKDDYVGSDNRRGVMAVVNHLVELGHSRIGFIHGPKESTTAEERKIVFKEAARKFALDKDPDLIFAGDYGFESGYEAGLQMLQAEVPPTAIIASNDINAMGLIEAAMESGAKIPDDLSIVGFDDITLSAFRCINLTTVHIPKREMGGAAGELLMKRIRTNRRGPARELIFPATLIVRKTTMVARSSVNRPNKFCRRRKSELV